MKYILTLLIVALSAFSNAKTEPQVFNGFKGGFTVSSVNFEYLAVSFNGQESSEGEIVFEFIWEEGVDGEVYQIGFIPNNPELFPYVMSGFYPKKIQKIGLGDEKVIIDALFTKEEWEKARSTKPRFISKKGIVTIKNYGTSVECDSRHYYASFVSYTPSVNEYAVSNIKSGFGGC